MRRIDLQGRRFGHWTVLEKSGANWSCRCDCGVTKDVFGNNLVRGLSQSCGCFGRLASAAAKVKHGASARDNTTPEYTAWLGMRGRCLNPNNKHFKDYGGRGIVICARWDDFSAFLEDMGSRPSSKHSVERDAVNGNYEPTNCRWGTIAEQASNKRNSVKITAHGVTLTQSEWARRLGLNPSSMLERVRRHGAVAAVMAGPKQRRSA